jgi:hypothetical protein
VLRPSNPKQSSHFPPASGERTPQTICGMEELNEIIYWLFENANSVALLEINSRNIPSFLFGRL